MIKFSQPSCVPCTMVENYLKDNEVIYKEVDVFTVDGSTLAAKYGIMGVPSLLLVTEDEKVLKSITGFNPPAMNQMIEMMK